MNKFMRWVETNGGRAATARKLGIAPMRVQHWVAGENGPQALLMQRIVKMTRGRVSYDDIINATHKRAKAGKR